MDRLIVLGSGNASATRCYNTCFALATATEEGEAYFLVDGGGGNRIFSQLDKANVAVPAIRAAFLSHSHTDHIFGMIWMLRKIATLMDQGKYEGDFTLYCHAELAEKVQHIVRLTLTPGMAARLGERIVLRVVADGECVSVMGRDTVFFDIRSGKEKQFGFTMTLPGGEKLAFLGDEPFNDACEPYVRGCEWLLSEAFCLYAERDIFKPYEKHHSTVREACQLASRLGVPNLVLWHTEDSHLTARTILYSAEGREFYSGRLFVPNDLDVIALQPRDRTNGDAVEESLAHPRVARP